MKKGLKIGLIAGGVVFVICAIFGICFNSLYEIDTMFDDEDSRPTRRQWIKVLAERRAAKYEEE